MTFPRLFALAVLASTPLGCLQIGLGTGGGSSSSGGSGGAGGTGGTTTTTTDGTCNAWKVSYCAAVALCGSVEEKADCEDRVGYVVCRDGAPFASCQDKLDAIKNTSQCGSWPDDCEPEDIADRSSPNEACIKLYSGICEWRQYCSPLTSVDDCRQQLDSDAPCSSYFAVNPDTADMCIKGYQVVGCGESIPAECATDQFLFR